MSIKDSTRYIDAWEQTARSTYALCEKLLNRDWERATDCPGWSVRDVVSHIIGLEREMLGEPTPEHHLPSDLVHIRSDTGRHMEIAVDRRRHHTPPEVLAELAEVVERRFRDLRHGDTAPDTPVPSPLGTMPYERLLSMRVFDVWAHEQDIRRAVRQPGNLEGPAARLSRDVIVEALPRVVAKNSKAPPRSSVVFDVTGPESFVRSVHVDEGGRGSLTHDLAFAPTTTLGMEWETFVRLACGRVRPDRADVSVAGDERLAGRVMTAMVITP
ncbi:MAG: maleylpyruvate isomerase family mycothiol-dependent enzyme [Carbonactinosporaceae bacterium]